jgi:hypothetical protein
VENNAVGQVGLGRLRLKDLGDEPPPAPGPEGGKQIERCVIASFQVAERMGFKGDLRQWEHLLRIGD